MEKLVLSMLLSLFAAACSVDYETTRPGKDSNPQDSAWVGKWLLDPGYPVRAETLVTSGLLYAGYWSWDDYHADGLFSHIQADGNEWDPEDYQKVVADTGTWRLLSGPGILIERQRTRCVGYNRVYPPGTAAIAVPCRTPMDTVEFRMFGGSWNRNSNQISQRWFKFQ